MSQKMIWIGIAILFLAIFAFSYPETFDAAGRASAGVLLRIALLAGAAIIGYQAYDALRSGLTGSQPKTSAPGADPASRSERSSAIILGVVLGIIAVVCLALGLNLLGLFSESALR